jgi:hypothetical protein
MQTTISCRGNSFCKIKRKHKHDFDELKPGFENRTEASKQVYLVVLKQ